MEGVEGGCSTDATIHAGVGVTLVKICKGWYQSQMYIPLSGFRNFFCCVGEVMIN